MNATFPNSSSQDAQSTATAADHGTTYHLLCVPNQAPLDARLQPHYLRTSRDQPSSTGIASAVLFKTTDSIRASFDSSTDCSGTRPSGQTHIVSFAHSRTRSHSNTCTTTPSNHCNPPIHCTSGARESHSPVPTLTLTLDT